MNPELSDVKDALRENYNSAMEIYHYTGVVRLTNGSAGMYVNIQIDEDQDEFILAGRRYSERVYDRCDRSIDALIETLRSTI